jgi:hypothetical protein
MDLRADVLLPFPRDVVFAAYRDRLPDVAEYLPNIKSIAVRDRRERGADVELVNEWVGGGDIPKVAQSILSESMLRWTDYATWIAASHEVDWRTEVHAFPGAVTCAGRNRFLVDGDGTRLEIRGALACDAAKVPGVPRLLAKTVSAAVEKMLVGKIAENLVKVGRSVGKLLAKERAAAR